MIFVIGFSFLNNDNCVSFYGWPSLMPHRYSVTNCMSQGNSGTAPHSHDDVNWCCNLYLSSLLHVLFLRFFLMWRRSMRPFSKPVNLSFHDCACCPRSNAFQRTRKIRGRVTRLSLSLQQLSQIANIESNRRRHTRANQHQTTLGEWQKPLQ